MRHVECDDSNRRRCALLPAFTLLEVLVATAIASLITALLAAILAQFFQITTQTSNRLALLGDITIAAQVISRDVNSATIATVSSSSNLTLTQPDPEGGATRTVVYSVSPPLLLRNDGSGAQPVARNVAADTAFGPSGVITGTRLVSVRLVSAAGSDSQTTTIQIALRPQP